MEIVLIEIVLWAGLILFVWSMRDALGRIEIMMQSMSADEPLPKPPPPLVKPEHVSDPIGKYQDQTIYRFAEIEGDCYQFEYLLPQSSGIVLHNDERCVPPGLVYIKCPMVR